MRDSKEGALIEKVERLTLTAGYTIPLFPVPLAYKITGRTINPNAGKAEKIATFVSAIGYEGIKIAGWTALYYNFKNLLE
jgi:hypothetical protein